MVIPIFLQNCSTWKISGLHHLTLLFCKQCNIASNHSENSLIVPNADFALDAFLMPPPQSGRPQWINPEQGPAKVTEVQQSVDRPTISMTSGIPEYSQSSALNKPYQCAKCNALSQMPGYGRIVWNSVILYQISLRCPKEFNIEVFMYFVKHKCVGLAHVEVSFYHGCNGALTVYSTSYQPSFVSSVVRVFLITHGHLDLPTRGKAKYSSQDTKYLNITFLFLYIYIDIYIYICINGTWCCLYFIAQ